jgi:hypothetical protein
MPRWQIERLVGMAMAREDANPWPGYEMRVLAPTLLTDLQLSPRRVAR